MISINFRTYNPEQTVQKNMLYRVIDNCFIKFVEEHKDRKEIVNVEFDLKEGQYGIYANEFRSPNTAKEGCKTTDVLSCVVDEKSKEIFSIIFDVKSNISAFSDNLLREGAMITAIKEVRDFIEQIHAEILHKKSFLLYYKDDGYLEDERVGIVTKNFEPEKFKAVAKQLEKMIKNQEEVKVPPLVSFKLKNILRPYESEIKPLCDFANKRIKINGREYDLQVFLLQQINESDFEIIIKMVKDTHEK